MYQGLKPPEVDGKVYIEENNDAYADDVDT